MRVCVCVVRVPTCECRLLIYADVSCFGPYAGKQRIIHFYFVLNSILSGCLIGVLYILCKNTIIYYNVYCIIYTDLVA